MRAIDAEKAIEIIEAKQKELCPVGRYGRNYVYGTDRERYDAWEEIIDALENIPTLTPPNEPLTLEQLRGMDGEPVWIVDIGGRNWYGPGWAIVDRENNLVRTVKNWNPVFFEKYGERWLAYCRPPERQEDT